MSRDQIRKLMEPRKQGEGPAKAGEGPAKAGRYDESPAKAGRDGTSAPVLPPDVQQYFVPSDRAARYTAMALGVARVTFADSKLQLNVGRDVVAAAPIRDGAVAVDWSAAQVLDVAPAALETTASEGATFASLPKAGSVAKNYAAWQKSFAAWLAEAQRLELWRHAGLELTSKPDESERDFRIRVQNAQREARDAEVEAVRRKYAEKRARLEERVRLADQGVSREQDQATHQKLQAAVSIGATVIGALLGRKAISATTLGRATTAARGIGRSAKDQEDVRRAQENAQAARTGLAELDATVAEETKGIAARYDADAGNIEKVALTPKRGQVTVQFVALGWVP